MRHPPLPDKDVDIDQGASPVHGHVLTRRPQPGVIHTPAQDLVQDPLLHLPIVDVVSPPLIPSPLIIPSLTRDDMMDTFKGLSFPTHILSSERE